MGEQWINRMITIECYAKGMLRRNFTLGLAATSALAACRGDASYSLIGKKLPSIRGTFTDGRGVNLAELPMPALIRFWGMWCGPCMIDMPNWLSVVRQLRALVGQSTGLTILTVHVGLAPSNGDTLAQWTGDQAADVATPVVDDANYAIMRAVGVQGTPSTLYIDKDGRIEEHAWEFKNARGVDSFLRKIAKLQARAKA
jgi:thiol-disulfide isomerase/thioredoxin